MGKGQAAVGRRPLVPAEPAVPARAGFVTEQDPRVIRSLWSAQARPDLWSDDLDVLTAFAGPDHPPLLVHDGEGRMLLLQRSEKFGLENLGGEWAENVRLPTEEPGWWSKALEELSTLAPAMCLNFTPTIAPLPVWDRYEDAARYTIPAYPSADALLQDRVGSERRRRLRKAPKLEVARVPHQEVWDAIAVWQKIRNGEDACFHIPEDEARFRRVMALIQETGRERTFAVREDGRLVGAVIGWAWGGSFLYLQDGHEPVSGLGNRVNHAVFGACFEEGLGIDWMTQSQAFKNDYWHFDAEIRYSATYALRPGLLPPSAR